MRLNFRLKGYVSCQYLSTVRWGNGYTTTLLLEVFTQINHDLLNHFYAQFEAIAVKSLLQKVSCIFLLVHLPSPSATQYHLSNNSDIKTEDKSDVSKLQSEAAHT